MSATRLDPAKPARAAGTDRLTGVLAAAWALSALAGMGILWRYKSTPGPNTVVQAEWPEGSSLQAAPDAPTLLVFAHPGCPCTRATLGELAGLLPRFAGRVRVSLSCLEPSDPPDGWNDASLRGALESLPGATLVPDVDGREAARFGVLTSGHVLLYGRHGELRYSGGVCTARGHMGDNPGLDALERALDAELAGAPASDPQGAPVFGCALFAPDATGKVQP